MKHLKCPGNTTESSDRQTEDGGEGCHLQSSAYDLGVTVLNTQQLWLPEQKKKSKSKNELIKDR